MNKLNKKLSEQFYWKFYEQFREKIGIGFIRKLDRQHWQQLSDQFVGQLIGQIEEDLNE